MMTQSFNFSYEEQVGDQDPASPSSSMSIDKLFPALLQCFGIILCGYIAGRANIITSTQAKGLGNFVSNFALPALLFKNMVLLNFEDVIWPFLWSILIAKVSVFFLVCVLTLVVASPESRYSKAGLFSIFATQSNDFALGFPIVEALYKNTYPQYMQYIYLVAPVSLMLLNPIGFALCEVQKWKNQENPQQSKLLIVGLVVLQVVKNPIVFMVVIGLVAHFLLQQSIPSFMAGFVDGLANSFSGAALFYLGLTMVGHLRKLTRSTVVTLILLITAKLLLMPLICKDMVELLDNNNSSSSSSSNHSSLSNYAFLYGVFPTAPSVAIYAVYYSTELEVVTSGLVVCTFLSAPIMYVSAWLLTIPWMDPKLVMNSLQNVSFNISIVSLVALVWTIAVMFLNKKLKRLPHMFTINLFLAQFLTCIGMILWNFVVKGNNFIGQVLTFMLLCTSLYSSFVWPALLALSLALMRKFEDLKVSPAVFVIVGWGVPALTTAVLLIFGGKMSDTIDSSFFYGKPQIICTVVIAGLSILLGGSSLVCLSRGSWTQNDQTGAEDMCEPTEHLIADVDPPDQAVIEPDATSAELNRTCLICDCAPAQPMPDMIISTSLNNTPTTLTGECDIRCESTECLLVKVEELQQTADRQVARHVLLCLLLIISLLANLSSCLWLFFNQVPGRLYLELQFFCAVANYGQGLLSFALFGLDKHLILLPFKKRLYVLWYGKRQEDQVQCDLPDHIRMTCNRFTKYHKEQCLHDIVKKRRCGKSSTVDCFLGCELVDWLQQVGLAQDRGEAVLYGTQLQQGGVLQHIGQEYSFQDGRLYYRFIT